jgi:hypothetical protein
MRDAISVIEVFIRHGERVRRLLREGGRRQNKPLSSVVKELLDGQGGWVSKSTIHDEFHRNLPARDLDAALSELESASLVEKRMVPTNGAPSTQWRSVVRTNEESPAISDAMMLPDIESADESESPVE